MDKQINVPIFVLPNKFLKIVGLKRDHDAVRLVLDRISPYAVKNLIYKRV